MFKKMKHMKNEKGLTLIELLAVIVILAIIAAIAIPAIGNIIENSRSKAVISDAIMTLNSANLYFADNPDAPSVTLNTLKSNGYIEATDKISTATVIKSTGEITFKGKFKGEEKTVTGTLAELNAIKVEKGAITATTTGATIQ